MAWTSPRTYVDGEILTAAILNADIRDNLLVLDTHGHDGTSGDGAATLPSLDEIQFDHQSGLGAGESGHAAMWMASDGTVRTHNNGGSELTLADTTHSHTQAEGTGQGSLSPTITVPTSYSNNGESLTQTPSDSTGSSQYGMCMTATARYTNSNGFSGTVYLNLEVATSQVEETSAAMAAPISTIVDLSIQHFEIAGANSSTVYDMDVKKSGSTNVNGTISTLNILEVQCL
jgi:hypothetical protein